MSEQNPPGDEPTRAYNAISDDDATRLDRPIPPYDEGREGVPSLYTQANAGYGATQAPPSGPGIIAPLVTVALLSILIGIGVGYLLFHNSSSTESPATTTTTIAASTTSSSTSSTTFAPTTTSTVRSSTTVKSSTTTAKATTTTVKASTTTTAKASTTTEAVTPPTLAH